MSEVTVYGIANCDTVKKAKNWLTSKGIVFAFHDYRKQGLDRAQLETWVELLGWQALLNKRGTTWRKLPDSVKDNINRDSAIEVMLENPAIIKRPLINQNGQWHLGFSESLYETLFH